MQISMEELLMEQQLGQLAPGRLADFIEVSDDPRRVAPDALRHLRVERTWVGGHPLFP